MIDKGTLLRLLDDKEPGVEEKYISYKYKTDRTCGWTRLPDKIKIDEKRKGGGGTFIDLRIRSTSISHDLD